MFVSSNLQINKISAGTPQLRHRRQIAGHKNWNLPKQHHYRRSLICTWFQGIFGQTRLQGLLPALLEPMHVLQIDYYHTNNWCLEPMFHRWGCDTIDWP
jgi:hypothetical protein